MTAWSRSFIASILLVAGCGDEKPDGTDAGERDLAVQVTPTDGAVEVGDLGDAALVDLGPTKLLSQLGAKCDGTDDTIAFKDAVTNAAHGAYTLVVDCTATLDIGIHIDRSIFIDNDTTIVFTSAGKLIINNLFEPAFAIVNSSNITLTNWNVEWNSAMPLSLNTDQYSMGDMTIPETNGNGSGQFNDIVLTDWLSKNRGIKFDTANHILAHFLGSVNISSIFFIVGETSNVTVSGLNLYSAHTDKPYEYIPFGFMLGVGWKNNVTVTQSTPLATDTNASTVFAVPSGLTFDHVTLDGIIMGWQGNAINSTWSNIHVGHVSDLQDADGGTVGGEGENFPPPHLFYLNYAYTGDSALFNSNLTITQVDEEGPRVGNVRLGGSGYANSLKLGCHSCTVDGYTTKRKDGFMDVLNSDKVTVKNVVATYDSSFVDVDEKWPAWRWPGGGDPVAFTNMTFSNVSITDDAMTTVSGPLGNNTEPSNMNIVMNNVDIYVNSWTMGNIVPAFEGLAAGSLVTFHLKTQGTTQTLTP